MISSSPPLSNFTAIFMHLRTLPLHAPTSLRNPLLSHHLGGGGEGQTDSGILGRRACLPLAALLPPAMLCPCMRAVPFSSLCELFAHFQASCLACPSSSLVFLLPSFSALRATNTKHYLGHDWLCPLSCSIHPNSDSPLLFSFSSYCLQKLPTPDMHSNTHPKHACCCMAGGGTGHEH